MSAPVDQSARNVSATQTDLLAADWLQRRQFWAWSDADQAELDGWLAQSRAHRVAYWRQKAVWSNAQRLVALRPLQSEAGRDPAGRALGLLFKIGARPLRAAAAIAFVAMLGGAAAHFLAPKPDREFSTAVGGHETVKFADGTKIELNTNTALRARMTNDSRTIWLERGEAYFQVKHDAAHPFTVIADGRRITDMGTKFVVRRDVGGLEVSLIEGKVRFGSTDPSSSQSRLLAPGDVATVSGNAVSISSRPVKTLTDGLSWRRGVLVFKYHTLADVAGEFNRYNTKKLVIADEDAGKLMIFGTFRTQDVDLFARVTQKALGLSVKDEGDQILISR